jgi:regulator of protease activity HflC (stomatin/prohibitin superfamily)
MAVKIGLRTDKWEPAVAEPASAARLNVVAVVVFAALVLLGLVMTFAAGHPAWAIVGVLTGIVASVSPKIAQQWERAVVLRLGRFTGLRGPGLFWIVPFVDTVTRWIDQRVITTSFAAEQS